MIGGSEKRCEWKSLAPLLELDKQSASGEKIACAKCGEPAEQAAGMFGITQRCIFRIIETGAVHYTESETGAVII